MADLPSFVAYPGIEAINGEITISRGITPSVALVKMQPQDGLNLSVGTLTITGGDGVNFPDCLPLMASLRKVKAGRAEHWNIEILDHRWRWAGGAISGEYNVRLGDGSIDPPTKKNPQELARLLLNAMAETGYDVDRMPANVYPYVKWEATNPARALANLCESVACEVCGGEFARVVIWPLGQGSELPTDALHHRFGQASKPQRIVFQGGPTVYQFKLTLVPMALDYFADSYRWVPKGTASYKPSQGWEYELPWSLPGVAAAFQPLAHASIWKAYSVSGLAGGGVAVPGCPATISDITQYLLNEELASTTVIDPSGRKTAYPAYVEGTYYPYNDDATNLTSISVFLGPMTLYAERHMVEFPFPVFSYTVSELYDDPTLYLATSFRVRYPNGNLVLFERTRNLGGQGGDLVIRRPEVFDCIQGIYNSDNELQGTVNNTGDANTEAQRYLDLFAAQFEDGVSDECSYPGVRRIQPDGKIAQTKFSAGAGLVPQTRAGRIQEFDIYTPSSQERRRLEVLAHLKELGRV